MGEEGKAGCVRTPYMARGRYMYIHDCVIRYKEVNVSKLPQHTFRWSLVTGEIISKWQYCWSREMLIYYARKKLLLSEASRVCV